MTSKLKYVKIILVRKKYIKGGENMVIEFSSLRDKYQNTFDSLKVKNFQDSFEGNEREKFEKAEQWLRLHKWDNKEVDNILN